MSENLLALLALVSPAVFAATAVSSWFQPGARPGFVKKMSITATLISILIAAISGFLVVKFGLLQSSLLGINEFGWSLRLDALSTLMLAMIALLGFIIMKFSHNYLDGDERQGVFLGRLAAAIAGVQLLVLAGNLGVLLTAWIFTSIALHRVLLFYPERPGAVVAARKKFIMARLSDVCLTGAVVLLYFQFGSGNLEVIFQEIRNTYASGLPLVGIETAALLLALAALLKSAQFPTHGWLIEVMETPTPVSALLHAGLLNAGPFLIVRMAYIMDVSTYAPFILISIGGFTALFASVVFLTQTSVKTALSYSSVAHMGFSLFVCGLGVYPAAMLHLVAHSFYKAHAFLSSGSAIDVLRASKIAATKKKVSLAGMANGIILALGVYVGFSLIWGINPVDEFSLLAVGAIIAMGLSRIFTSALDSTGSMALVLRACLLALLVAGAFFTLESASRYWLAAQVPALTQPSTPEIIVTSTVLLVFAAVVLLQIVAPALSATPFYRAMAVHVRNGLYINAVFDRLIGAWRIASPPLRPAVLEKVERSKQRELAEIGIYEEQPA